MTGGRSTGYRALPVTRSEWCDEGVFVRVWEYRVRPECVDAFERAYGAEGDWAQLFGREPGFIGTALFRDTSNALTFLTVDRWLDEESWTRFLARRRDEYDALDARCEELTDVESNVLSER